MHTAAPKARVHPPFSPKIPKCSVVFLLLICALSGTWGLSREADTCLACHSDASIAPVVNISKMDASIHSSFDCTTCHPGASSQPHDAATIKADCATCHADQEASYAKGIHGIQAAKGDKSAATCASCHGEAHAILSVKDPNSAVYHSNLPQTCGQCHSKGKLPVSADKNVNNAFDLYTDSIHGKGTMKSGLAVSANCSDCHGYHDILPKADPASPVNRANVPQTCGKCHIDVLRDWNDSSHAEAFKSGNPKSPVCTDCHVAHTVNRVDDPKALNALMNACSSCHKTEFGTYRDSFHGEVTEIGDTRTATCASCHGAHLVLPSVDPRSPTSPQNLVATCQRCHPGANASFTDYRPHAEPKDAKQYPQLHAIWLFMTVLLVGVFSFFGLHTLLWLIFSLRTGAHKKNKGGRDVR